MCVVTKAGLRLWVTVEQGTELAHTMAEEQKNANSFVTIDKKILIALSEIVGIFPPETIDDDQERRRFSYQCPKTGRWHGKDEECDCLETVIRPELGRRVQGPAGLLVTEEEARALSTFPDPDKAAVLMRQGHDELSDWHNEKRAKESQKRIG